VDAVVDKDRAAAILAADIGADLLLILTDVDAVYADWGLASQRRIDQLTTDEAAELVVSGSLGTGSMQPKLEAACSFVVGGGKRAVIAALENGPAAIAGESGTQILPSTGRS